MSLIIIKTRVKLGWRASGPTVPVIHVIHVLDYLAIGHGSAPEVWVMVPGMYGTHLKYGQCLQPISFNNLGTRLSCVIGVVWDASLQVAVGIRW